MIGLMSFPSESFVSSDIKYTFVDAGSKEASLNIFRDVGTFILMFPL